MNTPTNLELFEGAGFIFVNQNYDFLLVQDTESKKWGMCKGHRDQNDTDPLATAHREAHEELGLNEGRDYDVISGPLYIQGSPRQYIFYYAMLKTQMNNIVLQQDEVCDIKWVRYHDLPIIINKDEYNIYLRLLVNTTIGKPLQQQQQSRIDVVVTNTNFIPKYRVKISQPEINQNDLMEDTRPGSCYPELMKDDDYEDEVIIEPPPSAIEMNESYMFIPIRLDMVELLTRSFSRPSPSPRSRSCTSPFIPIGFPSPRGDGTMSPFITT